MAHPLQILVVEDEKALAHMIAVVLGGPASKVATARNGWQALIKIGRADMQAPVNARSYAKPDDEP